MHLVELAVDLRLVAGDGCSQPMQSNGSEISISSTTAIRPWLITRRACERVGDDLEEALAGPAGLRVDVVLQLADVLEPAAHRVHLVAALGAVGLQLAQHAVLVDAHHHQPQSRLLDALDPALVHALVGEVVLGPLGKLRVAARVVRLERVAVVERSSAPRRAVPAALRSVRAVGQRVGDAVRVPRLAAVEAARRSTRRSSSACGRRRMPPTRPYSVAPLAGVPVASSGASGKIAQPVGGGDRRRDRGRALELRSEDERAVTRPR